ncbi:hypothetical protein MO973_09805 [Paenibacillus sp. TRM 82003]|uniref:hypothetical protein n=1 Tax=Kineococcus sp. TRM81007 TaxID=2925831 RepID=UPI001F562224|nr:hypothetical protein [Kineococcus sp. TRM81007]MCI2238142.1 hypothetical protein [Kineococcus sp. TRM81007]MCI3920526.1 hypothetical protein [Paenibacillus sp. TRM 82003]
MSTRDEMPALDELRETGERALRELRRPLEEWLRERAVVDEEVGADGVVDALAASLGGLLALRPPAREAVVTRFSPEEVEALTGRVLPALVERTGSPEPEEVEADLRAVWYQFLGFLAETGRWSGPAGHLETCLAILGPEEVDLVQVLQEAAEGVGPEEEDAAVLGSFPVRAASAVLTHVGEGIAVPDDEELAPGDVAALLAELDRGAPGDEPPHLEDVPWLRQVVLTMLDLELLDGEDETALAPGAAADGWLGADPEARELRRELVGRFLLDDPATLDGGFSVAEAVLPTVLAAAVAGDPLDEAALTELVEEGADLGPAAPAAVGEVRERLADLAAFGLVSDGTPWTVQRGCWPAVAAAVAAEEDAPGGFLGGDDEPLWFDSVADTLGLGDAQKQQIRDILGGR